MVRQRQNHIVINVSGYSEGARRFKRHAPGLNSLINHTAGNVTIGITPGISDLFAAKLVKSCNRNCPAIRLNIEQDLSVRLVRKISLDDTSAFALVSGMECDAIQTLISIPHWRSSNSI